MLDLYIPHILTHFSASIQAIFRGKIEKRRLSKGVLQKILEEQIVDLSNRIIQ